MLFKLVLVEAAVFSAQAKLAEGLAEGLVVHYTVGWFRKNIELTIDHIFFRNIGFKHQNLELIWIRKTKQRNLMSGFCECCFFLLTFYSFPYEKILSF